MAQSNVGSRDSHNPNKTPPVSASDALQSLRERVFASTVGPGGITKIAEELDMRRDTLSRLIAPSTIRRVEQVERHLKDS